MGGSIQAMVRRARDLKLITEATYERHYRAMSAAGWRRAKAEPLDDAVPPVVRSLGRRSLELLEQTGRLSIWELSSEIPLPQRVIESVFEIELKRSVPPELAKVVILTEFSPKKQDGPGAE